MLTLFFKVEPQGRTLVRAANPTNMMKHILVAVCLLFAGAACAQERAQRSPEDMAKARTERLTTVLELTPEQQAKVHAMHVQQAKEAEARRTERQAKREQAKAGMLAKRQQHEQEMKSILSEEQYAKWQAMRAESKGHRSPHRMKSASSKK